MVVYKQGNQAQTEIVPVCFCSYAFSVFRPKTKKFFTSEIKYHKHFKQLKLSDKVCSEESLRNKNNMAVQADTTTIFSGSN
jgi:hypothetical protein